VRIGIRLGPFWISSGGGRSRRRRTRTYTASVGDWRCHHAHRTSEAARECAARNGPRPVLSPAHEAELQQKGRRIIQERLAQETQAADADLQRLRRELEAGRKAALDERPAWMVDGMQAVLLEGYENLEVVGESHYQDNLWQLVGSKADRSERIRVEITAVLAAEPYNPHDANAVAVWIDGLKVGHLSRDDAQIYQPGLLALQEKHGKPVALAGVIAGRGTHDGGLGRLGVFLDHNPRDFGIKAQ
jgi:HIRAN domain